MRPIPKDVVLSPDECKELAGLFATFTMDGLFMLLGEHIRATTPEEMRPQAYELFLDRFLQSCRARDVPLPGDETLRKWKRLTIEQMLPSL